MNRIGTSALGADELGAMGDIAGKLETLPVYQTLLETRAHQTAVVRNPIERTELVGAYFVSRGKMTAEMLEALAASWAKQALAIEPRVDFCD